ncbi:hypothetical protein D5086_021640 [Populus alba]|uniref:Uncharacterized protein n=1 Tax=Populus alba TaxID=43335 RepID=A0ACC4BCQ8_POPAL
MPSTLSSLKLCSENTFLCPFVVKKCSIYTSFSTVLLLRWFSNNVSHEIKYYAYEVKCLDKWGRAILQVSRSLAIFSDFHLILKVGGLTENDFILAAKINGLNLHHLLRNKAAAWLVNTIRLQVFG